MSIFASFLRGAYKRSGAKRRSPCRRIKHPVFKSFCRWQFAVNDQPVNIAFHDKGDFNDLLSSISILIHLLNDPLAFR